MLALGLSLVLFAGAIDRGSDGVLNEEQSIAARYQADLHLSGNAFKPQPAKIHLNTTPMISYTDKSGVHEAIYDELPPPFQNIFVQWAGFTEDEHTGHALFDDMFHKFFFVHELVHWTTGELLEARTDADKAIAIKNETHNHWETELETNRLAVAWWRKQDPALLARLVSDFRKIQAALPRPVPAGTDMKVFFADNYERLGNDPNAYGWFLLQSVIMAYDEPPQSFQDALDKLSTHNFA